MLVQGIALELRQNLDLKNAGVNEIVEYEVDDAVGSTEVDCGLCTVAGEGLKTAPLTACHDHAKDILLVLSRV